MNITPMQMYWLTKLDDIIGLHIGLLIISAVWTLVYGARWMNSDSDIERSPTAPHKMCAYGLVITILISVVLTFTPSTKQMAAIMIVPKIANSEKVQTIGNKVYDLAVEWMEELKPTKGSKVTNGK